MNHLAIATLELCVDEDNYEKAQQIFKEYANQRRFEERVVSGEEIKSAKWSKELPKQINYQFLHKVSDVRFDYSKFSEKAERELFAKSV